MANFDKTASQEYVDGKINAVQVQITDIIDGNISVEGDNITINNVDLSTIITNIEGDVSSIEQNISTIETDITALENDKMDKVPTAVVNHIAVYDSTGQVIDGGDPTSSSSIISQIIDTAVSDKMDKVPTAVSGHIAVYDTAGQVIDGGDPADPSSDVYTTINNAIDNSQTITDIQTDITNVEGSISSIQTDVSSIQTDITNIEGDISTIQQDIVDLDTNKMDKVPTAGLGNIATYGAGGQVIDSGVPPAQLPGAWREAVDTLADLPDPNTAPANAWNTGDWVTVRSDSNHSGNPAAYRLDSSRTWQFEIAYGTQASGWMEKVPLSIPNNAAIFNSSGQVIDGGPLGLWNWNISTQAIVESCINTLTTLGRYGDHFRTTLASSGWTGSNAPPSGEYFGFMTAQPNPDVVLVSVSTGIVYTHQGLSEGTNPVTWTWTVGGSGSGGGSGNGKVWTCAFPSNTPAAVITISRSQRYTDCVTVISGSSSSAAYCTIKLASNWGGNKSLIASSIGTIPKVYGQAGQQGMVTLDLSTSPWNGPCLVIVTVDDDATVTFGTASSVSGLSIISVADLTDQRQLFVDGSRLMQNTKAIRWGATTGPNINASSDTNELVIASGPNPRGDLNVTGGTNASAIMRVRGTGAVPLGEIGIEAAGKPYIASGTSEIVVSRYSNTGGTDQASAVNINGVDKPTINVHAANKKYVDDECAKQIARITGIQSVGLYTTEAAALAASQTDTSKLCFYPA